MSEVDLAYPKRDSLVAGRMSGASRPAIATVDLRQMVTRSLQLLGARVDVVVCPVVMRGVGGNWSVLDDVLVTIRIYTAEERGGLVTTVADLLRGDTRVEGVILVGSLANGGDRWSDIDLLVAVADGDNVGEVADGWRARLYEALPVVHHLEVSLDDGQRLLCLLLDTMLEIDLEFTPTARLSVYEPFRLIYDRSGAVEAALRSPPTWQPTQVDWTGAAGDFWHDVLHACIAVRRGRRWQALFYLERVRTATLRLASQRRGFYAGELNYVDDLPNELLRALRPTLVASLEPTALLAGIAAAARGFLVELREVEPTLADDLERTLLAFVATIAQNGWS